MSFKKNLGSLLERGFTDNMFDYQRDVWPPATPARAYMASFLEKHTDLVCGRVVEFNPPVYQAMFPNVVRYDVWNMTAGDGITVVGDLQSCPHIPDASFDAILCLHVLSAIRDVWAAARELHRLLADNGTLLVTVPCILQKYAPDPQDYWRFTRDSLAAILEPFEYVEITAFGNAATVAGSPYYLRTEHFSRDTMEFHDPMCPSILAAVARKMK
jgi:SAM-dependent methyltransferase